MPSLCIVISCALFMFVSNDNHCQAYRSLKACFKTEWKTTLHRKLLKSKRGYAGWFGVLSKLENQIQFTGNNRIFVREVTPKEAMINQKNPRMAEDGEEKPDCKWLCRKNWGKFFKLRQPRSRRSPQRQRTAVTKRWKIIRPCVDCGKRREICGTNLSLKLINFIPHFKL